MERYEDGVNLSDGKPEKSLFAKTAGGILWTGLGTGGQTLVQFVVLIVLARILTPEDFGVVAVALVVVGLSLLFSQLGVGQALVQRPNLDSVHIRVAFAISILMGVFFYVLIYLASPQVSKFFKIDGLTEVLRISGVLFLIKGFSIVSESLAQRELKFRLLAGITIFSYVFGFALIGIALALFGLGPLALVGAYLAQATIQTLALCWKNPHPFLPSLSSKPLRELMYFGGGFTLARLGNFVALQGDTVVVGRLLGASALGAYGRAYQIIMLPTMMIGTVLDKVLFPAMATFQHDQERLRRAFQNGTSLVALFAVPISVLMFVLAPEIIRLLLGPGWDAAVVPLKILSIGLLFRTSYKLSESLARATGAVYRRAWRQWVYAFSVVILSILGARYGLGGVAVGVLIAITINFTLMSQLSMQICGLKASEFLQSHGSGFAGGLIVLTISSILGPILREFGLGAFFIILLTVISGFGALFLLYWRVPGIFLGKSGIWLFKRITERKNQSEVGA